MQNNFHRSVEDLNSLRTYVARSYNLLPLDSTVTEPFIIVLNEAGSINDSYK